MNWTAEQKEAIQTKGCNLLISAAAGAGKTAVLVERVIRRLTDPREKTDLDRLLVVTFTQAAAAEMRERISHALYQALGQNPASSHLRRQILLLEKASITTLHSFCLDLLRQYFYLIRLTPSFRVMGEIEASLLRQEILEEVLEERYARALDGPSAFGRLVDAFGGQRDDRLLQDLAMRLYNYARTHPWPEHWLRQVAAAYSRNRPEEFDELPWVRALKKSLALEIRELIKEAEYALSLAGHPRGPSTYTETLAEDLYHLQRLYRAAEKSWDEFCQTGRDISFGQLRRSPRTADPELKEQIQALRQHYKDKIRHWQESYWVHTAAPTLAALQELAPLVEELVDLVLAFSRAYQEAKERQGLVDFSDLEHYSLKLLLAPEAEPDKLLPSPVALELQEQFVEVLVDEYQDINPLQDLILRLVSRQAGERPNLVLIGDVKQSIYRFRWAEPGLFLEKYFTYDRAPGSRHRRLDLSVNFRSRPEILYAVNSLFRRIMTPEVGEIAYDAAAELRPGAEFPPAETPDEASASSPAVELHLLLDRDTRNADSHHQEEGVDPEETEELETIEAEARLVAGRIRELVNTVRIWDAQAGSYRPVTYRDIVVLMRSTRGKAAVFLEELRRWDIPAYADTGEGYFQAPEVATMLSLLQIIDNPYQDIPLAAVLRSPLVGLQADDLAELRARHPWGEFAAAVAEEARSGEGPLAEHLAGFWQKLENWRTLARRGRLSDLIWTIYRETGFYQWAGGLPGGQQRQANLRALIDRARQYEQTSLRGLFGFLRFIERLRESGEDLAEAQPLGEKENVVRLMSVHKSKGLEFPIVILAGLGSRFNFSDLYRNSLIHREWGLGLEFVDPEKSLAYPTLLYMAVRDALKKESLAEELRILYVALTRAREKLLLVGTLRGGEEKLRALARAGRAPDQPLPVSVLLSARNYLDWILPALMVAGSPEALLSEPASQAPSPETSSPQTSPLEMPPLQRSPLGMSPPQASSPETPPSPEKPPLDTSFMDRPFREISPPERVPAGMSSSGIPLTLAGTASGANHNPRAWRIYRWDPRSLPAPQTQESGPLEDLLQRVRKLEPVPVESPYREQVYKALDWSYPYAEYAAKFAKIAVSDVRNSLNGPPTGEEIEVRPFIPAVIRRPCFLEPDQDLTPVEVGNAYHLVMQHLDLKGPLEEEDIARQIQLMAEREILTPEQAAAISCSRIARFFKSDLGRRLRAGKRILREIPFTLGLPADRFYPELGEEGRRETVVVQGIIDCLVDEGEGFLLLDYKTDKVERAHLSERAEHYRPQLEIYALAVETIYRRKVQEKYLYFFYPELAVSFPEP